MASGGYDNELRGALFRNRRKERDTQPDYRGEVQVRGEEFWLSAWLEKTQKGETYMKLSLQPKQQGQQSQTGGAPAGGVPVQPTTADEDIPF